jgi:hypothetical protein
VNRADRPLLRAVVADSAPSGFDPARQRRLAHEPVAPHVVEQLGLGDDAIAVHDQIPQHVEDLRLDWLGRAAATELEEIGVELTIVEAEDHPAALMGLMTTTLRSQQRTCSVRALELLACCSF